MNLFKMNTATAKEGKELTYNNLIKEINKLSKENEKLQKDNYVFMESNGYLEYEIKKLENENELNNNKIHEQDKMLFRITQENSALEDKLGKTKEERNIYKETINQICDRYNIDHKEVFKIIDNVNSKERER